MATSSAQTSSDLFLHYVPPMGIYETLYAFLGAFGTSMGEPGTHPWSQGFPRTVQLPGGPPMPSAVTVTSDHLRYPKAWGLPALREAIAAYYRKFYGAEISAENVMVFAGGRPTLVAVLLFLQADVRIRIASTEYTPYYDILERLRRAYDLVPSHVDNAFSPTVEAYTEAPGNVRSLVLLSNPCNPTGITRHGDDLRALVEAASSDSVGLLVDEAYELFHDEPVSALRYVRDIDESNVPQAGARGMKAILAIRHRFGPRKKLRRPIGRRFGVPERSGRPVRYRFTVPESLGRPVRVGSGHSKPLVDLISPRSCLRRILVGQNRPGASHPASSATASSTLHKYLVFYSL